MTILEQTAYVYSVGNSPHLARISSWILVAFLLCQVSSIFCYCILLLLCSHIVGVSHRGTPCLERNSTKLLPPLSAFIRNISGLALAAIPNVYKTCRVSIPRETNLLHRFSQKRRGRKTDKQTEIRVCMREKKNRAT